MALQVWEQAFYAMTLIKISIYIVMDYKNPSTKEEHKRCQNRTGEHCRQ